MDDVNCNGNENHLQDCQYKLRDDCRGVEGAGVVCSYSVQLKGGYTVNKGNVYALNSENKLGPVCDDSWEDKDASVVCRQLGYDDGVATIKSQFGAVENEFSMDDVNCNGNENQLQDCQYTTQHNCGINEGAGAICRYSAVHGEYLPWGEYSPCSETCG